MDSKEFDKIQQWAKNHPCYYLYDVGLLESYVFLFNCDGCPSDKIVAGYEIGLAKIKEITYGQRKFEARGK